MSTQVVMKPKLEVDVLSCTYFWRWQFIFSSSLIPMFYRHVFCTKTKYFLFSLVFFLAWQRWLCEHSWWYLYLHCRQPPGGNQNVSLSFWGFLILSTFTDMLFFFPSPSLLKNTSGPWEKGCRRSGQRRRGEGSGLIITSLEIRQSARCYLCSL